MPVSSIKGEAMQCERVGTEKASGLQVTEINERQPEGSYSRQQEESKTHHQH